jgi:transposase
MNNDTPCQLSRSGNKFVRVGFSHDHRPDRAQVTVGLSVDKASGMSVGPMIMPGNVVDVTHFRETFQQVRPLLPDDAMIMFDNGAYSGENVALLDEEGYGFVTRLQMNASDDVFVKAHEKEFIELSELGEDMSCLAADARNDVDMNPASLSFPYRF